MEIPKQVITFVLEMKKDIKLKGVLLEIVGTKTDGNTGLQSFDAFVAADKELLSNKDFGFQERGFEFYTKKLMDAKSYYKQLYNNEEFVDFLDDLSAIETLMLQYRSLFGIKTNMKLGTLKRKKDGVEKNYIVARCPFYNPNTVKTEIKVYLGTTDKESRSIEELSQDPKFLLKASEEVFKGMKAIIEKQELFHSINGIKNGRAHRELLKSRRKDNN